MKKYFGEIITNDDVDFTVVMKYLLNSWYILVIAGIVGGVVGWVWGNTRTPQYEMQATLSIPRSWQYLAEYPDSVMYQLARQYLAESASDASVVWISRPINEKGNMMNALVAIDLKTSSVEIGTKRLNEILDGLRNYSATAQTNAEAQRKVAEKISEITLAKETFAKDYASMTSEISDYYKELATLEQLTATTESLAWVTSPGVIAQKQPRNAVIYALIGAIFLGGFAGIAVLLPAVFNKKK